MPNGGAVRRWACRKPLAPDATPAAIEVWIAKAATDEWAYADLQRLTGEFLNAGLDLPPVLLQWALEAAAGRRPPPVKRGPKFNIRRVRRDVAIAATVELMRADGMTQSAAFDLIGQELNMSPKAVESARRRGLRV